MTTGHFAYKKPRTAFRKFADHVTQYTGRKLTYETNIMNAFRDLLAKSQFHNYYGIPIDPNDWIEANNAEYFNYGFARGPFLLPKHWWSEGFVGQWFCTYLQFSEEETSSRQNCFLVSPAAGDPRSIL